MKTECGSVRKLCATADTW